MRINVYGTDITVNVCLCQQPAQILSGGPDVCQITYKCFSYPSPTLAPDPSSSYIPLLLLRHLSSRRTNPVPFLLHAWQCLCLWHSAAWWVQWIRIQLPMQGTRVRSLVWEDSTCHRGAKLVRQTIELVALEPESCNYWSSCPLEPVPHQRSQRDEKPLHQHERGAPARHNQRKPVCGCEDPAQPKIKINTSPQGRGHILVWTPHHSVPLFCWTSSALFPPRADARPHHLPPTLSGVFARQELHKYWRCGWYNHYSILPAAIKLTKSWSTVQTQRQNTQPSNRKKSESQILRAERKRKRGRFWRKVHLKPLPERKVLKASKESLTTEREEGPRQLVLPSNV